MDRVYVALLLVIVAISGMFGIKTFLDEKTSSLEFTAVAKIDKFMEENPTASGK